MDKLSVPGATAHLVATLGGARLPLTTARFFTAGRVKEVGALIRAYTEIGVGQSEVEVVAQAPAFQEAYPVLELCTEAGVYATIELDEPLIAVPKQQTLLTITLLFSEPDVAPASDWNPKDGVGVPALLFDTLPSPLQYNALRRVSGVPTDHGQRSMLALPSGAVADRWEFIGATYMGALVGAGSTLASSIRLYPGEQVLLHANGHGRVGRYSTAANTIDVSGSPFPAGATIHVHRFVENVVPPPLDAPLGSQLVVSNSAAVKAALKWQWASLAHIEANRYRLDMQVPDGGKLLTDSALVFSPSYLDASQYLLDAQGVLHLTKPATENARVLIPILITGLEYMESVLVTSESTTAPARHPAAQSALVFQDGAFVQEALGGVDGWQVTVPGQYVLIQTLRTDAKNSTFTVNVLRGAAGIIAKAPQADAVFAVASTAGPLPLDPYYSESGGYELPPYQFGAVVATYQKQLATDSPFSWQPPNYSYSGGVVCTVSSHDMAVSQMHQTEAEEVIGFCNGLLAEPTEYTFLPGQGAQVHKAGRWAFLHLTTAGDDDPRNTEIKVISGKVGDTLPLSEHCLLFVGGLLDTKQAGGQTVTVQGPVDTPATVVQFLPTVRGEESTRLLVSSSDTNVARVRAEGLTALVFAGQLFQHTYNKTRWGREWCFATTAPLTSRTTIIGLSSGQLSRFVEA